jgi:hypothetical protein
MLGIYPAVLTLIAIIIGIVALALRRRNVNLATAHALVGIGLLGFGTTAWRMHESNSLFLPGGAVDPTAWMNSLGYSWIASGVVLPAVGVGLLLVAVSWLVTKSPIK